jgi:membrane protease subunit HflK
MIISSKRAEYAALTALILSLVFFLIVLLLGKWSGSFAVEAISWQVLASAMIWLVLAVQFHQRSLAQQEKLEMAQLAKLGESTTIFMQESRQEELFTSARRRLKILEKWFVPILGLATALYEIGIAIYLYTIFKPDADVIINQPLVCAGLMAGMAFVSFLVARYAIGMSVETEWRPLLAGGSMLLASALLCFAASVALTFAQFKTVIVIQVLAWVAPILLGLLGLESVFNLVMDIYRPRLKGQYSRSSFESRLLGLISEPGGILHTTASALDYQFGFKVSQTWFFKLMERAIMPLVLLSIAVIYFMSCFVIIETGYGAIVERFGKPPVDHKILGPGLHFKLPWPIDIAYVYPTGQIQQINVGYVAETDANGVTKRQALLWEKEHYKEEYNLLTATNTESTVRDGAVAVSLIRASVPIQYQLKNAYDFAYNNKDSEGLLSAICYREVVQFVASSVIESDAKNNILTSGRAQAAQRLKERIQKRADENGLGVEIIFLGLQGFHPPPKVAPDYEAVTGAEQKKQAMILAAMADRNQKLSSLAGSVPLANELYELAAQWQRNKTAGDETAVKKSEAELDNAFAQANGEIFTKLVQAQGYAYERKAAARADSERFIGQSQAFAAAPKIYAVEQRLNLLEEVLAPIRKYIVDIDPTDSEVLTIDLQEKLTPSLYDLTGVEEKKQ